jgi:hypothetical protein
MALQTAISVTNFASHFKCIVMTAFRISLLVALSLPVLLLSTGCSKGVPITQAVQKQIGAAGGFVISGDGVLEMVIPSGAISSITTFSIQPISNTLPASQGNAFRLLPENTPFTKPVTIRIHYDKLNLDNTALRFLYLCYQDEQGYWRMLQHTVIDEAAKTISIETTHFSDWSFMKWMEIVPGAIDPVTKARKLTVMSMELTNTDSAAIKLGKYIPVKKGQVAEWKKNSGTGTLQTSEDGSESTYTPAPNETGQAIIEVEVKDISPVLDAYRRTLAKTLKHILNLASQEGTPFVEYTISGADGGTKTYRCPASAVRTTGFMIIGSFGTSPADIESSILIQTDGSSPNNSVYAFGPPTASGVNFVRVWFNRNAQDTYEPNYLETTCNPYSSVTKYSSGQIQITRLSNTPGVMMTGNFTGTLNCAIQSNECPKPYKHISITGSFSVRTP